MKSLCGKPSLLPRRHDEIKFCPMQLSPETVRTTSEEEGMLVGTDALQLVMAERVRGLAQLSCFGRRSRICWLVE